MFIDRKPKSNLIKQLADQVASPLWLHLGRVEVDETRSERNGHGR